MSVELYFDMIGRKTAALIAASIEAGALLATDDEAIIARYRAFGWALGLAFQLNDDLLGIWGPEQATGKEPTDVAAAQEDAAGDLRARARRARGPRRGSLTLYADGRAEPGRAWPRSSAILERTGARDYTRDAGASLSRRGARRARRGRRRSTRRARARPRADHPSVISA